VSEEVNDEIFSEVTYHAAYEPMRCVRTRRWKYIRRFGDRLRTVLPNCDDGPSKDLWLANGWGEREHAREELYDTVFDPNESRNVAGEAAAAEIVEDMRGRLDRWMQRTGDPLLKGEPVPAPTGVRVNDPDAVSPGDPMITL
jgi:arylsulfatase A-like enzyme